MMPDHPENFHFALTGFPLGHSLSPLIHTAALSACNLHGDYRLHPIPPDESENELSQLFDQLRRGELHGLNVTIPHKQVVLRYCDELSPVVRAIGAGNLFFIQDGKIIGDNSDVPGFLAGLQQAPRLWNPTLRTAAVLGAGGSARAVVYALASAGWMVHLFARRVEQSHSLAASLRPHVPKGSIRPAELSPTALQGLQADLVVNTTPVGMAPEVCCSPWPSQIPLPAGSLVYDLVYNPRNTLLIDQARAQSLPVIGGIHMLVEQAAISFETWTGCPAPRNVMLAATQAA